ncbi:hypothetical protein F373_gp127 [Bacillus phage SP-10]|uniref:hypothetical protein n=1 Tax=Bacillus phage SP10 TaxID=941058 RepID=UPI0002198B53|nr:hypothetical protein F373_gp127 [Bacillus phage SP-10]BAK52939.1 hypothetical protein [Bacillus phage SP-10]
MTTIKMNNGDVFYSKLNAEQFRSQVNGANNGGKAIIEAFKDTGFTDREFINLNLVSSFK